MYRKILFPTDGSKDAEAATGHLIPLAIAFAADVVVLEVVEPAAAGMHVPVVDSILTSEKDPSSVAQEQQAASDHLTAVAEQFTRAGLNSVTPLTKVGRAADKILETVDEQACDAIVMATHGRSAIKRFFLGSVAERIVRDAPCPVILVPARAGVPVDVPAEALEV